MKRYPEISTTYIDGRIHTLDAAVKQLRDIPQNSVALLGIWRIDNRGITYMNNSVYAFSKANPELPVFSLTATAIGYWAIGGYIPQYDGIGRSMGEQAYQFLDKGKTMSATFICCPTDTNLMPTNCMNGDFRTRNYLSIHLSSTNRCLSFRHIGRKCNSSCLPSLY